MPHDSETPLDIFLRAGVVSQEQVDQALRTAAEQGVEPLRALVASGAISNRDAIRLVVENSGGEFVDLVEYQIDPMALMRISGEQARRDTVVPLRFEGSTLVVAVPPVRGTDVVLKDDLSRIARAPISFAVAMKSDIEAKIAAVYRADAQLTALTHEIVDEHAESDLDLSGMDAADDAPIVRFVNTVITQAIADRASDIHIEPTEHELIVRYRIDGVLKTSLKVPIAMGKQVISRLKIMAGINIAEKRIPQDGRLSVMHQGRKIDLRVATLPVVWGIEKVVMRILDNSTATLSLDELGFSQHNFDTFKESYTKPYGMILVTGPTGSGKSTTLYATLNIVAKPEVNVITVEDPVEYRIANINQVQVNQQAGMTFAAALRSILRSDPDIVLIGEIRDHETAQIAVEAALTGHLVLSTLHTNDAPSAITRLTEMGIEPFLVGSALDSVLAQRLCRRLCAKCKEPYTPEVKELTAVGFPYAPGEPLPTLYQPVGCTHCSGTGYRGRIALHEVMPVSEEIERLTVAHSSASDIAKVAKREGMLDLRADGWHKVAEGMTSIKEVLRVVA